MIYLYISIFIYLYLFVFYIAISGSRVRSSGETGKGGCAARLRGTSVGAPGTSVCNVKVIESRRYTLEKYEPLASSIF